MSYAKDVFWEAYREYVASSQELHAWMCSTLMSRYLKYNSQPKLAYDLGCGRCREGRRVFPAVSMIATDTDASVRPDRVIDYRDLDSIAKSMSSNAADSFVSMFSVEISAPPAENNEYYLELFRRVPSLRCGLSYGFYYSDRRHDEQVNEAEAGINEGDAYQTIGDLIAPQHLVETRLSARNPSKLFGPNVVDVARFFFRADQP